MFTQKARNLVTNSGSAIRASAGAARISFVSGNFNIVHPGHLRLLKLAADIADILVVGLTPDGAPGVTMTGAMRLEGVRALSIVDHAFVMDTRVADVISELRPDFVVKGKEFEGGFNPEAAVVENYGGKLIFSSGDMQFASVDLLRQELAAAPPLPLLGDAEGYPARHGLAVRTMHSLLNKMATLRVAVVGDIIVDDYIMCDPLGMSQEDPTIVVSPIETQTFVGGAAIVAAHARSFGAKATLFTVFGADETAEYARDSLKKMNVDVHGVVDETRPTTRKQRYRALDKTLLRVNLMRQHAISKQLADQLSKEIIAILPDVDLLLFSDFNYGCLPQDLVNTIAAEARRLGVMMTADSQASSQMADISRFKGMGLITPTEREARLAMRDTASGLAVLVTDLRQAAAAENVLITLGEGGMMVHGRSRDGEYMTDRLPALNATPKDVAGAGDSVFTSASMAICTGADIWLASYLGGIAAAIQVSRIGNIPLDLNDIRYEINQIDR
jgi:rfaE bifunctional protein kinase chain/domain